MNNINNLPKCPSSFKSINSQGDYANIRPARFKPAPDGDWDDDLIHLKGIEAQAAARQCPMDRLARLAVLQQFEQVSNLLKTEIVEHAKAKAILDILE